MKTSALIARYDGRVPCYTSYPTAPHFSAAVSAGRYAEWLGTLPDDAPTSLYLHVPFCDRLCLYCACNTSVVRQEKPKRAYAAMLEQEIRRVASAVGRRAEVGHIHWGGGTPTTLPADCLTNIMSLIRREFLVRDDAEVAIEIDPTALPPDRLAALGAMGINRVSLGVQDFDPAVQAAIGRHQSYETTAACAQSLRTMGIDALNLDLIYGLPHQTEASVARTVQQALGLNAGRIAVFGYAHVPWMKRHQALIPEAALPGPEDRYAQRQEIEHVLKTQGGYRPVGLDHYARPTDALAQAAESGHLRRNFQGYTTDVAPVLIGFGASAIGSLPQGYVQNATASVDYTRALQSGGLATARGVALTADDRLRRDLIERIMCDMQVDISAMARLHAADDVPLLTAAEGLARFCDDGLVRRDGARIEVTEAGRPFVRNVAALFDAYLPQQDATPRHAQAV